MQDKKLAFAIKIAFFNPFCASVPLISFISVDYSIL